jgi:hypothetical protein
MGKVLGIIDLFVVMIIIARPVVTPLTVFIAAGYLIVKGGIYVGFMQDMAGFFDLGIGAYLVLMALNISFSLFTIFSVVYLVYKALTGITE